MDRAMPEAAKLYFKNWDVLETAKKELIAILDSFWAETWPEIQEHVQSKGMDTPRVWENKSSPGTWVLNSRDKLKKYKGAASKKLGNSITGIEVAVNDPRVTSNPNAYNVRLRCSGSNLKKLKKERPGAIEKINRVAKKYALELDWENSWRLCRQEIAVDPQDLTGTWGKIADATVELLHFLDEVETSLKIES